MTDTAIKAVSDLATQISELSALQKVLVWIGLMAASAAISWLALELDWRLGFRSWFVINVTTTILMTVTAQCFVWTCLTLPLWGRGAIAALSLVTSFVIWFLILFIGTLGGMRGVPAGG